MIGPRAKHRRPALVAVCCAALTGGALYAQGENVAMTLENDVMQWQIGTDGRSASLVDKSTGRNWAVPDQPVAFVSLGGKPQPCTAASAEGNRLTLGFGDTAATAVLRVDTHPRYVTVTVETVSGPELDHLQFLSLVTGTIQAYIFAILATVYIGGAVKTGERHQKEEATQ